MNAKKPMACREALSNTLLELAAADPQLVVVTTDARGSVGLGEFVKTYPAQFVEAGIAEQNAITVAAGLANTGKRPFVCAPSAFMSARSFEQIKVDLAYSNMNVKVAGVSGGVSYGPLGGSHHAVFDIANMRSISGLTVVVPSDAVQTREVIKLLHKQPNPAYIRMGRRPVPIIYDQDDANFAIGKARILRAGNDISVIACGETVAEALAAAEVLAAEGIELRVVDMFTVKPIDVAAVLAAAYETSGVITAEEHSVIGGLGGAVAEVLAQNQHTAPLRILGLPDSKLISGSSEELFRDYGIDAAGIAAAARKMLQTKKPPAPKAQSGCCKQTV